MTGLNLPVVSIDRSFFVRLCVTFVLSLFGPHFVFFGASERLCFRDYGISSVALLVILLLELCAQPFKTNDVVFFLFFFLTHR